MHCLPVHGRDRGIMALIVLEPGESFEHQHEVDSTSQLLEGHVRLDMNGSEQMPVGAAILTPAGVKHCMVNTGIIPATVRCAHAPPPGFSS